MKQEVRGWHHEGGWHQERGREGAGGMDEGGAGDMVEGGPGGRGEGEGEEDKMGEQAEAGEGSSKKLSKKQRQVKDKEEKKERYRAAALGWGTGQFSSLHACAKSFGVDTSILHRGIVETGGLFPGKGRFSTLLKKNEEEMVANHVRHMATIGYGVTWPGLRCLLQEVLLSLTAANPSRKTGLEDRNQLPSTSYVQRFAARIGLSLRKTSAISKGRAVISPVNIKLWFADISSFLDRRPDLLVNGLYMSDFPTDIRVTRQLLEAARDSSKSYTYTYSLSD